MLSRSQQPQRQEWQQHQLAVAARVEAALCWRTSWPRTAMCGIKTMTASWRLFH
jgi:hypothetical protein